jgi:hypothetical protein
METTRHPASAFTVTRFRAELTVYTGEQTTRHDGTPGGWVYVNVWCTHEHLDSATAEACRDRIDRHVHRHGLENLESVGAAC